MEKGTRRNYIGHGYDDRISSLPESILLHILSFLPTKFAIRTSVLSKTWSHLWTNVPTLDFDDHDFSFVKEEEKLLDLINTPAYLYQIKDKERDKERDKKFLDIVDQFLMLRNRTDIHKFRLWYSNAWCARRLNTWFEVARKLNTRELDIGFHKRQGPLDLPLAIFSTKSLETFKLDLQYSPLRVPSNVGFSQLKILQMERVTFSYRYFYEDFFSNSPTLESLTLRHCEFTGSAPLIIFACGLKTLDMHYCHGLRMCEMKLKAPNLVTFSYVLTTVAKGYDFTDLASLVHAKIRVHKEGRVNCSSLSEMITGLHVVKVLSICGSSIEILAAEKPSLPTQPMLQNVEHLNMIAYLCNCPDYMKAVSWFFSQCPNLKKLVVDNFERKSKHLKGLGVCTPALNILSPTMSYLTEIEIKEFKTDRRAKNLKNLLLNKSSSSKKADYF